MSTTGDAGQNLPAPAATPGWATPSTVNSRLTAVKPADQQLLRSRTASLALEWATSKEPPFDGGAKEEFATVIVAAEVVADEARHSLTQWVAAGRRAGLSWAEIGDALGISRQAAQQRFGGSEPVGEGPSEPLETRLGVTAFSELDVLAQEGARGRELVQVGMLKLLFRPTGQRWEYRRTIGLWPVLPDGGSGGWQYVTSWFPYHYFKRPVQAELDYYA